MYRITPTLLLSLLALALFAAPGCGENPVGNSPTDQQNTTVQHSPTGQSGGTNSFVVEGDGYAGARFAANSHFGTIFYGSTSVSISAMYDGQPATLAISLRSAGAGTYRLDNYNMVSMTITKGFARGYNSVDGTVTITDIGSESGVIRGSFAASVVRYDTGTPATVSGEFAVARK